MGSTNHAGHTRGTHTPDRVRSMMTTATDDDGYTNLNSEITVHHYNQRIIVYSYYFLAHAHARTDTRARTHTSSQTHTATIQYSSYYCTLSGLRFISSWGGCNSSMLLVLYSFILHRSFTRIVHTLVHTRSTRLAHAAHSRITINPIRSFRSIIQRRSHLSHSSVITHRHSLFEHSHTNARTTRCCHS